MIGKKEEYLYIHCLDKLCRVNLTKLSKTPFYLWCDDDNGNDTSSSSSSPFEVVVDFIKEEMPILMCHVVVVNHDENEGSKLYLVGGLKLNKGFGVSDFYNLDRDECVDGFNEFVYAYRPSSSNSNPFQILSEKDDSIPNMQKPKENLVVATLDDNTFVFSGLMEHTTSDSCCPTFEVYQPTKNSWTSLPEPPRYVYDIITSFFLGRTLYVKDSVGFMCYNVDTGVWNLQTKYVLPLTNRSYDMWAERDFPFLAHKTCHVALVGKCAIAYAETDQLVVFQGQGDGDTINSYNGYRVLHELKPLFEPTWEYAQGFVFHLGQGKMCFLLTGSLNFASTKLLRVSTFQFKPDDISLVLTNHVYNEQQLPFNNFDILHAFVMFDQSGKRALESSAHDTIS